MNIYDAKYLNEHYFKMIYKINNFKSNIDYTRSTYM